MSYKNLTLKTLKSIFSDVLAGYKANYIARKYKINTIQVATIIHFGWEHHCDAFDDAMFIEHVKTPKVILVPRISYTDIPF